MNTTEPPALLREALEQRRAAGLLWHDSDFEWLVFEVTAPMVGVNSPRAASWREVLLDQAQLWHAAYEQRGPGSVGHSLYALL